MGEIREYCIGLLKKTGCPLETYYEAKTESVISDLNCYYEKNKDEVPPFPVSEIAEELIRIGNEQPVYPTDGRNGDIGVDEYICKYYFSDLNDTYRNEKLQELLKNRIPFDTKWLGSARELLSCRIQSNGQSLLLSVHAEMDDYPDILSDYGDFEADEDAISVYDEIWCNGEWNSETEIQREIKITTYEDVVKVLCEMEDECSETLHRWYLDFGWAIGALTEEQAKE